MDPIKETSGKNSAEVALMIKDGGQESTSNHGRNPKSPEIKASLSPKKLPSLVRRRSIVSSAFAKPKSRFVEQSPPPAGPGAAALDEEYEEEEIYKKESLPSPQKGKRKWKCRILAEWALLILALGCLIASLSVHKVQISVLWGLEIWRWCIMVMVVCSGHLIARWLVKFLVFFIERNFLLKKKVLYFVYGLKNSVQACIWLGLVLLSWSLVFDHGVHRSPKTVKVLRYVTRSLVSLLIGSVLWLAKTFLVKLLASSFHMNAFFDRIQESIFHQYVLQKLSGPPVMELAERVGGGNGAVQLSFRSAGKGKGKDGEEISVIDVGKLQKMQQEKVSAWTMKGLVNAIRSSGLTTISNTIDETLEDGDEQRDTEITSEWEARAAAYRIFKKVAKPGHKYIDEEDLMRFFSKEEVETVLPLFEGALDTRKIKRSALKNWVVKAYFDRKSLAHSLNDTKTAVKQLHNLATVIVIVIIIIVTLLLMGFATTQVLVVLSSQILLVGFMFQNTCKMAFEAIIFVFIMHPFDVGDRCVVDGVQMIVEEMNILTTVFLRYDNEKIYYPNSVLAIKPISNFYRSPDMSDSVEFSVDFSTSVECIAALKAKIKQYIEYKPNHWRPTYSIVVKDILNINKMNMALYVKHTMNFQNMTEKNSRRTDLVLEMKKIFEELSIKYHLPPQEVQLTCIGSIPTLL